MHIYYILEEDVMVSAENPIYTINDFLKKKFGCKVVKLSLDGGFTCPNRDGSKGVGGCIFCSDSGSGDFAGDIPSQIALLSKKWSADHFLAYFQNHTNTYAPVAELRSKYTHALAYPGVVGLAVATRPDCLPKDVLDLLSEINENKFTWVELGLQTASEDTALVINRCYPLSEFDAAMENLALRKIRTVVHLIFGLPGETKSQMLDSLRYVCRYRPFGLKLHLLNVIQGSALARLYPAYTPFESIEEYVELVCDALEIIPPEITLHRLTADVPRSTLLAPHFSYQKRTILNGIHREMKRRGSIQGIYSKG